MSRPPNPNPHPRKKRSPKRNEFNVALDAAEKMLAEKSKARHEAFLTVERYNAEIPHLKRTIEALKLLLHPPSFTPSPLQEVYRPTIDADPREVPEGAGFIPANGAVPGGPVVPDIDSLPHMDGNWQ